MSAQACLEQAAALCGASSIATDADAKARYLRIAEAWLDLAQLAEAHDLMGEVLQDILLRASHPG